MIRYYKLSVKSIARVIFNTKHQLLTKNNFKRLPTE